MEADRYGHCCLCHKDLLVPRVVGGKQIMMFSPEFDQTEFIITNKSRMVVCMCKTCKASVDLTDATVQANIMASVIAGWDMEMASVGNPAPAVAGPQVEVSNDMPLEAMAQDVPIQPNIQRAPSDYHDLNILFHSEGIDDYVVKSRFQQLGI